MRSCVQTNQRPLRVALVSYRSKAHVGGQGIYLRHLSRELAALGHHVEVYSGQPYPELEPGPVLRTLPSLDLYREPDPFRTPKLSEYRDWIDVLEFLWMKTGAFPEPFTFSLRLRRALLARLADFDLVHDNQVLAYGLLALPRAGMPLVTSIHHPISVDRRIELKAARGLSKLAKWRWYSFVRMQARVARRCGTILTASQSSAADICRDFGAAPESVATLLRAFAKLATERDVHLVVVGRPGQGGPTERLVAELALGDKVRFAHGISDAELAELAASAQVAVVPSLYEGFSLPAVEHMASGTPLIVSRTGALPEVVGDTAVMVQPGDPEELIAALRDLLDSPQRRAQLGEAAWRRVQERFAWPAVARATVTEYERAIAARRSGVPPAAGPASLKGAEHC